MLCFLASRSNLVACAREDAGDSERPENMDNMSPVSINNRNIRSRPRATHFSLLIIVHHTCFTSFIYWLKQIARTSRMLANSENYALAQRTLNANNAKIKIEIIQDCCGEKITFTNSHVTRQEVSRLFIVWWGNQWIVNAKCVCESHLSSIAYWFTRPGSSSTEGSVESLFHCSVHAVFQVINEFAPLSPRSRNKRVAEIYKWLIPEYIARLITLIKTRRWKNERYLRTYPQIAITSVAAWNYRNDLYLHRWPVSH